jgi:hypothetical protein
VDQMEARTERVLLFSLEDFEEEGKSFFLHSYSTTRFMN